MNKFLPAILILVYLQSYGQSREGNLFLGMSTTLSSIGSGPALGGLQFSTSQVKVGDETSNPVETVAINIVPKVGYFFSHKFAAGLDLNYAYKKINTASDINNEKASFAGVGAFGRYYFFSKISPFVEMNVGMGTSNIDRHSNYGSYIDSENYKSFFYSVGGSLGLSFPMGSRACFDLMANYHFLHESPDEKYFGLEVQSTQHTIGFECGVNILIGSNDK